MARPRLISDEQILSAMRRSVLAHGAQVPLDVVAEALGVTAPALLKRFGSRQALMLEALRPPDMSAVFREFEQGPDARPLEAQLAACVTRLWAFFEEMIPCVAALRESGIPPEQFMDPRRSSPAHAIRALTRWLELAVERGLVATDAPETVATMLLGALQTRAFTSHVTKHQYSSRSNKQYLEEVVQFFTRALAARPRKAHR